LVALVIQYLVPGGIESRPEATVLMFQSSIAKYQLYVKKASPDRLKNAMAI